MLVKSVVFKPGARMSRIMLFRLARNPNDSTLTVFN